MRITLSFLIILLLAGCRAVIEEPLVSHISSYPLQMVNYLGNTENIHPKVLYFENGWNGYEFWMAYTPYPGGATDAENPCIAVSHDGVQWTVPAGHFNPLQDRPPVGYNSDTHLVYDEENNRMECWWRTVNGKDAAEGLFRRTSLDGSNWTETESVIPFQSEKSYLSPAVWIQNGIYNMVYCDGKRLYHTTTAEVENPGGWSNPKLVPILRDTLAIWHHDVVPDENGDWDIVFCATKIGSKNRPDFDLFHVKIKPDLKEKGTPVKILGRSDNKEDFDSKSLYRSSFVKVKDMYYLYYSAISQRGNRSMALLRGPSLFDLHPLPEDLLCP